jgi:hypothetical protein
MKRNFLIALLLVIILATFALAQDPGVVDTCLVERVASVPASSQVVVNIYLVNDSASGGYSIPLAFPDSVTNLDITCDSISFVGTRSAAATYKSDVITCAECIDNTKNRISVFAIWFAGNLAAGDVSSGPIAKIYFTTGSGWDPSGSVALDTVLWPPATSYEFSTEAGIPYYPVFGKGALEVRDVNTPATPKVFSLSQNYPNPFNPKTVIRFGLPKDSWVNLDIYNVLGQRVKTLVDERLNAGMKEVEWDGKDDKGFEVSSGIYFYKIKAGDFSDIKKMVMLK